jgi:hypothetical protein
MRVATMISQLKPQTMSTMIVLATVATIGCSDERQALAPVNLPAAQPTMELGTMRATVDVVAGTMTFEPITTHGSLGGANVISAAIYGNQGVTVRIYNSPVVTAPSATNPAKKTFTANVGIRNLLSYPVGDEEAGATPADTMGLDVFMGTGPTVTATSSECAVTCSVTVKNADGARAFNAPNQLYWHYHDRLGAAGSGTDTTHARKVWSFEADTQVTNFSFSVVVNAPWPAPFETRWKIDFPADSAPESAAASIWQQVVAGAGGTVTVGSPSAGMMTVTTNKKAAQAFARYDSLASTTSAYMEVRAKRNDGASTKPEEVVFGLADDTKFIAIGMTASRVGFLTSAYIYSGTTYAVNATAFHTYQIRKFGADSVQLLIDGTRVGSRTYASLPNTAAGAGSAFFFGGPGAIFDAPKNVADVSMTWDYVTYEIGVSTP